MEEVFALFFTAPVGKLDWDTQKPSYSPVPNPGIILSTLLVKRFQKDGFYYTNAMSQGWK